MYLSRPVPVRRLDYVSLEPFQDYLTGVTLDIVVTTQEEQGSRSVGKDSKVYSTINRYN